MKELLKGLSIDEETIEKIEAAMKEEKIFTTREENIDIRYAKLKEEKEELEGELTKANGTLKELQEEHKDLTGLQEKIGSYEEQIEDLKAAKAKERKELLLKTSLEKAGAKDIDYLTYKLGGVDDLELDEEGNIVDLDNKIKDLQQEFEGQFAADEGPKPLSNKLPEGESRGFTVEEVRKMSPEEINENWDNIKNMNLNENK